MNALDANLIKLPDDSEFAIGHIPSGLRWDASLFERIWMLHPPDRHLIRIHGKLVETPRWQQAYGHDYRYTGNINRALTIPAPLVPLLKWAREALDNRLNGILVNWYEGPKDYIGPHHDSVHALVRGAPIVTVSFGKARTFRLSRGKGFDRQFQDFTADDGSVFIMPFDTNLDWKHEVRKSTRYRGQRISVTFRAFSSVAQRTDEIPQ